MSDLARDTDLVCARCGCDSEHPPPTGWSVAYGTFDERGRRLALCWDCITPEEIEATAEVLLAQIEYRESVN